LNKIVILVLATILVTRHCSVLFAQSQNLSGTRFLHFEKPNLSIASIDLQIVFLL